MASPSPFWLQFSLRRSHDRNRLRKSFKFPWAAVYSPAPHCSCALALATDPLSDVGGLLQSRIDATITMGTFCSGRDHQRDQDRRNSSAPAAFDLAGSSNVKQLYGGWSSGRLFGRLGEDALTLSFGRETFDEGDGALQFGAADNSCDTGCWLQRRSSRLNSTAAKLKTGALQGRVFYFERTESRPAPALGGISASASASALSVGASYAQVVTGSDPNTPSEGV